MLKIDEFNEDYRMNRRKWVILSGVFILTVLALGGLFWYLMQPVSLKGSGGDMSMPRAAEIIPDEAYVNGYFMEDFGSYFPENDNLLSISCSLSGRIEKGNIRIVFFDDSGRKYEEVAFSGDEPLNREFTFNKPEKGITANLYSSKDAVFSFHYSFSAEVRRIDQ